MEELSEQEKHQLTLEGLADVDAGRVIEHYAVQAWANSLTKPSDRRKRDKDWV